MRKTLGLDFGHCEVAMSLTMDGKKPEGLILDGNKEKVIPAQIALTDQQIAALNGEVKWGKPTLEKLGKIVIGKDSAPVNDNNPSVTTFMYFKKAPAYFGEVFEDKVPRGALMAAYLYQLIEQVFDYNPDYLGPEDRDNIQLVVGCPTTEEWTGSDAAKKYEELIRNATGISNVSIIPESRAAMFSSIESAQTCVSASNGAVVFDFGSSTADCTYMLSGRRCIEYSWRLGAQEIEAQMAKAAFQGKKPSLSSRIYVTNQLREQKQLYYNGLFGPKGQRLFYDVVDKNNAEIEAAIRVNDATMNQVVGGEEHEIEIVCNSNQTRTGTWKQLCKEFFQAAKEILDREKLPCDNVVLTGGASKMTFVQELCAEVFGPGAKILVEKNPSFSVANGLGWVSAIDARVPAIVEKSNRKLLADKSIGVQTLAGNIAEGLQPVVQEVVAIHAEKWAQLPGEHALSELVNAAKEELDSPERRQQISLIIDKNLESWRDSLQKAVQNEVNANVAELLTSKIANGVILTGDVWKYISGKSIQGKISLDDLMGNIDMGGVLTIAEFYAIVACLGALWGLIGVAIGMAITYVVGRYMSDKNVTKPRDAKTRSKLKPKIIETIGSSKTLEEMTKSVFEELKEMNDSYPEMVQNTVQTAYDVVTLKQFEK